MFDGYGILLIIPIILFTGGIILFFYFLDWISDRKEAKNKRNANK
jgi:preprotein translocase subunit YajC